MQEWLSHQEAVTAASKKSQVGLQRDIQQGRHKEDTSSKK